MSDKPEGSEGGYGFIRPSAEGDSSMTDKEEITRRLARVENELGINPNKERFKERCKRLEGRCLEFDNVEGEHDFTGVFNVNGSFTSHTTKRVLNHFEGYELDTDEGVLYVYEG